jgi:hypothetical protein
MQQRSAYDPSSRALDLAQRSLLCTPELAYHGVAEHQTDLERMET